MSYKTINILAIRERTLAKFCASLIVRAAPARASPELNKSIVHRNKGTCSHGLGVNDGDKGTAALLSVESDGG